MEIIKRSALPFCLHPGSNDQAHPNKDFHCSYPFLTNSSESYGKNKFNRLKLKSD